MKLFRNPLVKKWLCAIAVFGVSVTVFGFLQSVTAGVTVLFTVLGFTVIYLFSQKSRYHEIEGLSEQLHEVLIGKELLSINKASEGELSVLTAEVNKLLLRLKEQNESLTHEKHLLCDSLADISHQLKTPLTGMRLIISLLREPELTADRRLELTRQLYTLLVSTENLVELLLKAAKLDADAVTLKKEPVTVKQLMKTVWKDLEILLDVKNITLCFSHNNARFTGDLQWSAQALSNIIKNCAEHTPEGGTITVSASETPIYTQITVSDTGGGFYKEDIPRLFERFYKGQNAAESSNGIGLNLAQTIIKKQNGSIKAYNKNSNACFDIKFYKTVV